MGKQLDYILSDKKHYKWSRDAEACDTIHMGSDHRCVRAKFEIPDDKEKGKTRKTKAPPNEQECEKSDDQKQQKYLDLEQKVKEVDSRRNNKELTSEAKEVNAAAAEASEAAAIEESTLERSQTAATEGTAALEQLESERSDIAQKKETEDEERKNTTNASAASAAAAVHEGSKKRQAVASKGSAAAEVTEANEKDERIRALIHERKTCGRQNKDRIRDISKEIKKCIRENKRLKRQKRIETILEKVKGTKNINSIKSAKKRVLIPKVKNKEGEAVKTRQGIANVFAKFYEELYVGEEETDTEDGTTKRRN